MYGETMAGLQIKTCCDANEIAALLEFGQKLLEQPNQAEQPVIATSGQPNITKSLNKVLRAGHQLHFVHYKGQEYVFKVFADLNQHSRGRRLDFFLQSWLKNPARRSYQGAYTLQKLNIPAIQPLACLWVRYGIHRRGLFIYESVQAEYSLKSWLESSLSEEQMESTLNLLCQITRKLEASNYYFADLKLSNILVKTTDKDCQLVLIDTDDILKSPYKHLKWLPEPLVETIKLWHLRRLKPDSTLSKRLMEKHWPEKNTLKVLKKWYALRNIQTNPIKLIKRKLRNNHAKKTKNQV